jgi:hypothetical protein
MSRRWLLRMLVSARSRAMILYWQNIMYKGGSLVLWKLVDTVNSSLPHKTSNKTLICNLGQTLWSRIWHSSAPLRQLVLLISIFGQPNLQHCRYRKTSIGSCPFWTSNILSNDMILRSANVCHSFPSSSYFRYCVTKLVRRHLYYE